MLVLILCGVFICVILKLHVRLLDLERDSTSLRLKIKLLNARIEHNNDIRNKVSQVKDRSK